MLFPLQRCSRHVSAYALYQNRSSVLWTSFKNTNKNKWRSRRQSGTTFLPRRAKLPAKAPLVVIGLYRRCVGRRSVGRNSASGTRRYVGEAGKMLGPTSEYRRGVGNLCRCRWCVGRRSIGRHPSSGMRRWVGETFLICNCPLFRISFLGPH